LVGEAKTRIQLAGRFVVELSGRRIESSIPRTQCRVLFAFLALNRFAPVSRGDLIQALWDDESPPAVDVSLRALVSKLRSAVGHEVLQGRSELQLVFPTEPWIDFEAALEAIHRAESAVARGQWHDAWWPTRIALNTAKRNFLADAEGRWVEQCRRLLEDIRLRAHEATAAVAIGVGGSELPSAERSARALIDETPFRESGYRLLMEALAARGNVAEALLVYDRLRCLLRDELGTMPAPSTQALHRELLGANY
jgi:DNA-binding SARP family transcriptional activator